MSEFRFPRLLAALATCGCLAAGPSADAQLVRVGPWGGVNIRLPFVSVDTLPFGGGTRVRAPFTSVNTGLYGYGGPAYGPRLGAYIPRGYHAYPEPYTYADPFLEVVPVYPVPIEPVLIPVPVYRTPNLYLDDPFYDARTRPRYDDSHQTARPDLGAARPGYRDSGYGPTTYQTPEYQASQYQDSQYRNSQDQDSQYRAPANSVAETALTLRQAAARLDRALGRRADDADVWRNYLAPQEIMAMIDGTATVDIDRMQTLQTNYEGVAGNPDLSDIWVLDGFRRTHEDLKSWLSMQGMRSDSDQVLSTKPSVATVPSGEAVRSGENDLGDAADSQSASEDLPPGRAEPDTRSPTLADEPEPFDAPDRVEGAL